MTCILKPSPITGCDTRLINHPTKRIVLADENIGLENYLNEALVLHGSIDWKRFFNHFSECYSLNVPAVRAIWFMVKQIHSIS